MRKRARFAELLDRLGLFERILRARTRRPWFSVLTFHRMRPPGPHLHDDGVVDMEHELFDRQLRMLARHCDLVGIDDLVGFHADGRRLPRQAVMLSFDDGYRDNHDLVLPTLRHHGARGTFFVATSFVTDRRVFWWDRLSYLIKSSQRSAAELGYPRPMTLDLADRPVTIRRLLRVVKDTPGLDVARFLGELGGALDVAWDDALERRLADQLIMTWEQVQALAAAGMDVESHTVTHRVLQTLPAHELADELGRSRAEIAARLGRPVRALSYPCGKAIGGDPMIVRAVADAGYAIAFTNEGGMNTIVPALGRRGDPLQIRRISPDLDGGMALFRGVVALPLLADAP